MLIMLCFLILGAGDMDVFNLQKFIELICVYTYIYVCYIKGMLYF